jgi:hypothetical protein
MTKTPVAPSCLEPELPAFLRRPGKKLGSKPIAAADRYHDLLNQLRGELGFHERGTALRWLLDQLEESADLRHTILLLLQQG